MKRLATLLLCFLISLSAKTPCSHEKAIYDCFIFFNEIDLLKIRLAELYDVVDYFVIVESTKTFSAKDKPSYFKLHEEEFVHYRDKIIHILLDRCPSQTNYWENEFYQRNQILAGLAKARPYDIAICSDLDEIPKREIVEKLRYDSKLASARGFVYYLIMDYFIFKLNYQVNHSWCAAFVSRVDTLRNRLPQGIRSKAKNFERLPDAGWHFSWIGNPNECLYKLKSFSHAKDSFVKDDERMLKFFEEKDCSYNGNKDSAQLVPIDENFPAYIRENLGYFLEKNLIELPE